MKKRILCLILVLMLLPIASFFSACKKNNKNDLTTLKTDFYNIAEENNNIKLVDGKLIFDYSAHSNLQEIIQSNDPYKELADYNYVFNNLMSFSYSYVNVCSINSKVVTKQIKQEVEDDLNDLRKTINDVNENINIFAEIVIVASGDDITASACLARYKNLLVSYEDMFQSAINFNSSLSNLYFNYILNESNPNVYSIGKENFDANIVVNKLESRIKYQLSSLSQSFVEMYVDGSLAEKIVNKETTFDLTQYNYQENVDKIAINQDFDEKVAAEKANHENNKPKFYELSVQAQNIQATMNNDRNKFITACNNIEYSVTKFNDNASAHDKMCASIIESNYDLISTYNDVLAEMIKIITDTGA